MKRVRLPVTEMDLAPLVKDDSHVTSLRVRHVSGGGLGLCVLRARDGSPVRGNGWEAEWRHHLGPERQPQQPSRAWSGDKISKKSYKTVQRSDSSTSIGDNVFPINVQKLQKLIHNTTLVKTQSCYIKDQCLHKHHQDHPCQHHPIQRNVSTVHVPPMNVTNY